MENVRIVRPMSASGTSKEKIEELFNDDNWVAEEKLDGARYTLHIGKNKNRLFSRNFSVKDNKPVEKTDNVPHLRDASLEFLSGMILDGEIVINGGKCTSSDVTKVMGSSPERAVKVQKEMGKVYFKVFDVLCDKNGVDLKDKTYSFRRGFLEFIIPVIAKKERYIKLVEKEERYKKEYCEKIMDEGGEGVILKNKEGKYYEGARSNDWIKVKKEKTWDVVIVGYSEGGGKYKENNWIGAIKFGIYRKGKLEKIGQTSGMTEEVRAKISANKKKYLGKVIEVKGQQLTKNLGIRHPRFKQFREDKNSKDCTEEALKRSA